ncbi:MAG: 5-deoxy-glucuronate isomerase [Flavobacteriales bacterium AspAUS03]
MGRPPTQVYPQDGNLDKIVHANRNNVVMIPKAYHPVVMYPLYKDYSQTS